LKTVEEVKQLINQRLIELKELPSSVWICKELEVLLAIIDEPPPCTHPNRRFFDLANTIKLAFLTMAGSIGATNHRELMKSECCAVVAKFCPDCGEKLND